MKKNSQKAASAALPQAAKNAPNLSGHGIRFAAEIIRNPSFDKLFEEETREGLQGFEKGLLTKLGAVDVMTGAFTGRSPKDKYFVVDDASRHSIWWDSKDFPNDNHPISEQTWQALRRLALQELEGKRLFVVDAFCGANPATRLKVRFIMEVAWQAHFVTNMFIQELGLRSETAVAFSLKSSEQVILNTWYGGEMKKGLFSIMNYLNPLRGIASMHCSANTDLEGRNTAIFFGLSGTGKTTLSTDPKRLLIGDDEHGWDDDGIFNYEGGCYAKVIDLDAQSEPDIYHAIKRNALLENVTVRPDGSPDFTDRSVTENTRVSYPIQHIDKIVKPVSRGPAARHVIFLAADAYGVLPPVSLLSSEQAQYYFLSGYTSKLAGTEIGINAPKPAFSACFGQAFLSLHPLKYAEVLAARAKASGARFYLVNTGWNGTGRRISIRDTRAIIDAILSGEILQAPAAMLPIFRLQFPTRLPGADSRVLDPRSAYETPSLWEEKARALAAAFRQNFQKFERSGKCLVLAESGPKA